MWSRQIAEQMAAILEGSGDRYPTETILGGLEETVGELAEAFRYLPAGKIQWVRDFAEFLRQQRIGEAAEPAASSPVADKLCEVREFALFLKERHGYSQPVEESDEWSAEDRRDFSLASLNRLEKAEPSSLPADGAGEPRNA